MLESVALALLFAVEEPTTTMPRHPEVPRDRAAEQTESRDPPGVVTDYLFDNPLTATDDPTFVSNTVAGIRQGILAANNAGTALGSESLRNAAAKIGKQNEETTRALEGLARKKGWPLQERAAKPGPAPAARSSPRAGADFIINQIAFHETTLDQFRAQLSGKGDAELKRALRAALPGYQRNLELLFTLTP